MAHDDRTDPKFDRAIEHRPNVYWNSVGVPSGSRYSVIRSVDLHYLPLTWHAYEAQSFFFAAVVRMDQC
jgi:hypothetical protein